MKSCHQCSTSWLVGLHAVECSLIPQEDQLLLLQCRAAFGMIPPTLAWIDQNPISQHVLL
jgi:hypothetical protein